MIFKLLIAMYGKWRLHWVNARDLERINSSAARLNAEVDDVLRCQAEEGPENGGR